jgi:predicted phage-related endonuclease
MIEQRSEQWFADRAGRITASRFVDAIAMNKRTGAPTAARDTYMRSIVAEILSGRPRHSVSSQSLSWGTEAERFAIQAYELDRGVFVEESGFIVHPEFDYIGGSPDGLVGNDGLIEIKCPHDEQVHIGTWLDGMPTDHIPQVQGNLMVTGRKWLDFISYDPRQSERFQLYVQRIGRDDEYINSVLLPGLHAFWADVQKMVKVIEEKAA